MDNGHDDVEQRLPPEEPVDPGTGVPWGGLISLLGITLIVVFAVQNTEDATIEFLWLSGDFPLSIVILVTGVASALFALAASALFRSRRRRRRAERQELRRHRSED